MINSNIHIHKAIVIHLFRNITPIREICEICKFEKHLPGRLHTFRTIHQKHYHLQTQHKDDRFSDWKSTIFESLRKTAINYQNEVRV